MVRRTPFANGSEKPTPRTFQDKLSTLKEASRGLDPESTLRLFDFYIQEALTKGELTEQQASGIYQSLPQAEIKETIETFERENFSDGTPKLTKSQAKSFKFKNPDLFNKIIELAETKELGPTAIARHPDVLKLNKGKEISYGSMQRIITNEKGKSFFKDLTKQKSYFVGDARKKVLSNNC